jgi:hypothetical protein
MLRHTPAALLVACAGTTTTEYEIDHYVIPCLEEEYYLCPLVRETADDPWAKFFEPIGGWSHTWGVVQRVVLTERGKVSVRTDSASTWTLNEVLAEEPVAAETTFAFPFEPTRLDPVSPLVAATDAGGVFADGQTFTCADVALCTELDGAFASRGTVVLTLAYLDPAAPTLELRRIDEQ